MKYVLVPFYCSRRREKESTETRLTGRVPIGHEQSRFDYSLVDREWEVGHPIEGESIAAAIAEHVTFEYRAQLRRRVSGKTLIAANTKDDGTVHEQLEFYPPANAMAHAQLHALGTYLYQGEEREVYCLTTGSDLTLTCCTRYKGSGFYYETTAASSSRDPAFVHFIFDGMRKLGFKSDDDLLKENS